MGAQSPIPKDRLSLSKASFFLQGFGCLLPWNAFLTITSYWSYKLQGSRFFGNYMNYFIFLYTGLALVTTFGISRLQHLLSLRARVLVPQAALILCYALFLGFVHVDAVRGDLFFFVTIAMLSLSSIASGTYEACLFTIISVLPPIYTTFMLSGEASAGVSIALLNTLSILFASDDKGAATVFFSVALGALCLCCLNYVAVSQSRVVTYYFNLRAKVPEHAGTNNGVNLQAGSEADDPEDAKSKPVKNGSAGTSTIDTAAIDTDAAKTSVYVGTVTPHDNEKSPGVKASAKDDGAGSLSWADYFFVVKRLWLIYYTEFILCFVTLGIYPTVPGSIAPLGSFGGSLDSKIYKSLWLSISVYLPYTTCDFIIRTVAGRVQLTPVPIAVGATVRIAFLPFFLLCNSRCWDYDQGMYVPSLMPKVFMHDVFPIIFVMLFALSHGFFLFQGVLVAPTLVEGKLRPVATSMCVAFMVLGCLLGSLASFGVRGFNCGMNPFAS